MTAALTVSGLSCSGVRPPGREETQLGSRGPERDAAPDATPGSTRADEPDAGGAARPEPVLAVVLDLVEHVRFADLRTGSGVLCDLGSPGQSLCTRGGFRAGWGAARADGEATFAVTGARASKVWLSLDEARDAVVTARLRASQRATLDLALRGSSVGTVSVEPGDWRTVTVPVPAASLVAGLNELQLRVRGASRAQVDWVALGPGQAEPRWPRLAAAEGAAPSIVVPRETGLTYTFSVPPGARVALTVAATAERATLTTRVTADGSTAAGADAASTPRVTTIEPGRSAEVSVELVPFEGRVARLDLTAGDGELRVSRAVVLQSVEPAAARHAPQDATNLVIVLIDTLRADHLTTYAPSTRVRTPGFGAFAERGVVFEQAQAQENWTKPSVATLLTSLYPSSHNTKSDEAVLADDVDMIGEVLRQRGFATAAFIANGYVSGRFGFEQGWDQYRNYVREGIRNRADRVVDDTIAWLDSRPQGQPFFLYVHTIDPHVPYSPPRRYWELYDAAPYDGPIVASRTAQLLADIKVGRLTASERDRTRLEALYDGEITFHDDHFSRLIEALEQRGLLESTVVWVTSDHGEEFFDHGSVGHGHSLYQELLHVPLVAIGPGLAPGRIQADVGLIDVMPTSLALLGQEPFPSAQGRSRVPLLRGEPQGLYDAVYSEFLDGGRSARSRGLSLLLQGSTPPQLYDLVADPREQRNVAAERPIALRHMLALLSVHLGSLARQRVHQRREEAIDDETLQQLRALGYMLD